MNIKMKMIIFLGIPSIFILFFSISSFNLNMAIYSQMSDINNLVEYAVKSSSLVHELQKERGATAGFMGSGGSNEWQSKLDSQRKNTDIKKQEFDNLLKSFDQNAYGNKFSSILGDGIHKLSKIKEIRNKVNSQSIKTGEAIGYYTSVNSVFLLSITTISTLTSDGEMSKDISSYSNFLNSKERAGIERAVLSNTFSKKIFGPGMYEKFNKLIAVQKAYMSNFLAIATDEYLELYKSKTNNPSFDEVTSMRKIAIDKYTEFINIKDNDATEIDFGIEGTFWFDTISKKINILKEIEDFLSSSILLKSNIKKEEAYTTLLWISTISILILLVLIYFMLIGINKSIIRPIKRIVEIGSYVSLGEFEVDIDINSNDEIGQLAQTFSDIINILNNFKSEYKKLSSAVSNEKYSQRCETSSFNGNFKEILNEANLLMSILEEKMEAQRKIAIRDKEIKDYQNDEVKKLNVVLNSMANSDLSKNYNSHEGNENTKEAAYSFSKISEALNISLKSLNNVLTDVKKGAVDVNSSSGQVSAASKSLADGATTQAASLEQISSSIVEINSQTNINSSNSDQANKLAKISLENAKSGNIQMKNLISAMEDINASSTSILNVIKTIDDIAFQVNLLSLNAAVEAARAGKHGKGFAVVADEVRNLAGRSAKAASETAELIDDSIKKVAVGTDIVKKTATALEEIETGSTKVTDLVSEISLASNEQASAITQISTGIGEVSNVTQQIAANSEETAAASEEMSSQAIKLESDINSFKLNTELENQNFLSSSQPDQLNNLEIETPPSNVRAITTDQGWGE